MDKYEYRRQKLIELKDKYCNGRIIELAERLERSHSYVSRMLYAPDHPHRKRIGDDLLDVIAQKFNVTKAWLNGEDTGLGNTAPAPDVKPDTIPLISWVQAGAWNDIVDNFQPGDAEEWISTTTAHSKNTFALRVSGESMKNEGSRESFDDGDIILVDPYRDYCNGSLVVVRLNGDKTATFKKLIIEDNGTMYLRPLNPNWPQQIIPIDEEAQICGVVFEKVVRF